MHSCKMRANAIRFYEEKTTTAVAYTGVLIYIDSFKKKEKKKLVHIMRYTLMVSRVMCEQASKLEGPL